MKRDMNLVRELVLFFESVENDRPTPVKTIRIPGFSSELIVYNCEIMAEHGLILIANEMVLSSGKTFDISRLTWTGHEFADAARDESIWNKTTARIKSTVTSMAFDSLVSVLKSSSIHVVNQGLEWLNQ